MVIEKIEKARKSLIKITLSDDTAFLLDREFFLDSGLCVGFQLDEEQIEKLQKASDLKRAKARAVYYLSNGDLSKKALVQKLKMAGFMEENCYAAMVRMCELGYIDEERYAKRLLEILAAQNTSLREAQHKLYEKGIEPEIIKTALLDYDIDPVLQIKNIIDKKYSSKLTDKDSINKVFTALVRKGFDFGDIKQALREYAEFSED